MNTLNQIQNHFYEKLIAANLTEYGDTSRELNFISPEKASEAEFYRANIIGNISNNIQWAYADTKPYLYDISPGCRICGSGSWSCLFINGKCNCRCFYCPTVQDDISVPTTNRLAFKKVEDYKGYIGHFDFQGVSISGGEPLMTFDLTLDYLRTVRKNSPDRLHIWMYTNGTLMTPDHIRKLKDAGLNEIRFDIGATDYDITKLKMAVGHIPVVTVEIPAVPEDMEKLSSLIPVMFDTGVNYLNLHQLRLTPHNSISLKNRNYTFLHGEKVTVLESELAVLSLFSRAIKNKWQLPINYCAFTYKNQFQRAAARKRNAKFIIKPFESATENGFIRSMSVTGTPDKITGIAERLAKSDKSGYFEINGSKTKLFFHHSLWELIDFTELNFQLSYYEAILSQGLSYRFAFKEILLKGGMKLYVEKQNRLTGLSVNPEQITHFENQVLQKENYAGKISGESGWHEFEFVKEGLQAYF